MPTSHAQPADIRDVSLPTPVATPPKPISSQGVIPVSDEPSSYGLLETVAGMQLVLGLLGCGILVIAAFANNSGQLAIFGIAGAFGIVWSSAFALVVLDAARKLRSIDAKLRDQSADSSTRQV